MKKLLFVLFVICVILLNSCVEPTLDGTKEKNDISDITRNPEQYVGKIVTIEGKMIDQGSPDIYIIREYGVNTYFNTFVDDNGYFVNVITDKRYFEKGNTYTVVGKFIKTDGGNFYLLESQPTQSQEEIKEISISGTDNKQEISSDIPIILTISGVRNTVTITENTPVNKIVISGVDITVYLLKGTSPEILDSGVRTKIEYY